jgi:cytochrome c peroxidase
MFTTSSRILTRGTYRIYLFPVFILFALFTSSCTEDVPNSEDRRIFNYPSYFPEPVYSNEENEITKDRFELGRLLFYDRNLSMDSSISCGSCHAQVHGFADHNTKFSIGVQNQIGERNSPPIFNMAWNKSFMWDGGINHIEVMPLAPFTNPVEMNMDMKELLKRLNQDQSYRNLFESAYNKDSITDKYLFYALTQFMVSIVSDQSDYDYYRREGIGLSDQELKGLRLVEEQCGSCHPAPLYTSNEIEHNGLSINKFNDVGHARISQDSADQGKFKVPSLRNLKFTYPYMHDGRFRTLEQVLNHYTEIALEEDAPEGIKHIKLNHEEKESVLAFLETLNDMQLLSKKIWSDPIN